MSGSGTLKVTIVGTPAQVDADLGTLSYSSTKTGSDTITVAATDSNGGKAAAQTIAVTVSATPASAADLLKQYVAAGLGPDQV